MRIDLSIDGRVLHQRIESLKSLKIRKLALTYMSANSRSFLNDFTLYSQQHLTNDYGIDCNEKTTQHVEADKDTRRHQPLRANKLNDEAG